MTYKAIEKIDKYNIGDKVPTEIAVVWEKMYLKSPVEKVEKKSTESIKEKVVEKVKEETPVKEESKGFFGKKKSKK